MRNTGFGEIVVILYLMMQNSDRQASDFLIMHLKKRDQTQYCLSLPCILMFTDFVIIGITIMVETYNNKTTPFQSDQYCRDNRNDPKTEQL